MLSIQLLLNGIVNAVLYALIAVAFGIVLRSLKFLHLAVGGIYVFASYVAIFCMEHISSNYFLAICISFIATLLLSLGIDFAVYRPISKKKGSSGVLLIASLGVLIVLENLLALLFGNNIKIFQIPIETYTAFGGIIVTSMQLIQFTVASLLLIIFWYLINKYTFFKLMWALGDNEILIKTLGLPYQYIRSGIFLVSSFFIAAASLLITFDIGIDPHVGMHYLLIGAVAVIVGGTNSFMGWIAGAFVVAMAETISSILFSHHWSDAIVFSILIGILLFRPQGLVPASDREEA